MRAVIILALVCGLPIVAYAMGTPPPPKDTITIKGSEYKSLIQAEKQLLDMKIQEAKRAATSRLKTAEHHWELLTKAIYGLYIIVTLAFAVALFLGPRLLRSLISSKLKKEFTDKLDIKKEELEQALSRALGYVYDALSLVQYNQGEDAIAIIYANKAMETMQEFESSTDRKDQDLINNIIANRAYFMACLKREEDRGRALSDCDAILSFGRETGEIRIIDIYIFVLKAFGRTPEEKRKWIEIYEEFREPLNIYLSGIPKYSSLVKEYSGHSRFLRGG